MILNKYLDDAKKKLNIKSDSELSLHFGFSRGAVNAWRMGKSCPDDYSSFMLAEVLKLDPRKLISRIRAEYEKDSDKKEFWKEKVKEYGFIETGLLAVILSVFVFTQPIVIEAFSVIYSAVNNKYYTH